MRDAPLDMDAEEFRDAGHALVDQLADFIATMPGRPVVPRMAQQQARSVLGDSPLPEQGSPARELLPKTTALLAEHSLFNSHPKFFGYITSPAAPVGAMGELIAGVMNANLGAVPLSPMASAIEAQTVRWIAELLRYPVDCGGLLVSGGNVANFIGFLAARRAAADWDIREQGLRAGRPMTVYCSAGTHTWIQKAADLFGLGTDAVRWIATDADLRMDMAALRAAIATDRAAGHQPLLVVGTAGTVGTGTVDPLRAIATLCEEEGIWFHVDGAYGAFAAALDDAPEDLHALGLADSIAVDPHKWLYAPIEAGCALVREPRHLVDAFSFQPEYYFFGSGEDRPVNYHELGLQNSRGFRALKVWLGLQVAGKSGCAQMIGDDIELARRLHRLVDDHPEFEARTCELSITTFRYVPLDGQLEGDALNEFNQTLLEKLQEDGRCYPSNAVVNGDFLLRCCVVNFRTQDSDIDELPELIASTARELLEPTE